MKTTHFEFKPAMILLIIIVVSWYDFVLYSLLLVWHDKAFQNLLFQTIKSDDATYN